MTDLVRHQLLQEKSYFKYDYGNDALDPWLTDQLVGMLDKAGIPDLRQLAYFDGVVPMPSSDGISIDYVQTHFFYNALTGKQITGLYQDSSATHSDIFAITHNNDWTFKYHVQFLKPGFPVFTVQLQHITKDPSILASILPIAIAVASLVVPGIAQAIGQYALGVFGPAGAQMAAAYPALANGIGNACVQAATNGGDLEKAVASSLTGFAGTSVGSFVSDATNVAVLGQAAGAVTSSLIKGENPTQSLAFVALQSGVGALSSPSAPSVPIEVADITTGAAPVDNLDLSSFDQMSYTDPGQSFADFGTTGGTSFDFSSAPDFSQMSGDPSVFDTANAWSTDALGTGGAPLTFDSGGAGDVSQSTSLAVDYSTATYDSPQSSTDSAGINWDHVLSTVSTIALTALRVLPAFQAAGHPAVRIGGTSTNADGSTTTVNADGTITTHFPNGTSSKAPTPTGQPYFLADGSTVTNNGNGTYTVIRPDGKSATMHYGGGIGGISTNALLLGVAGVAAVVLLRR